MVQHVPQGGGGQKPGGAAKVVHVGHGVDGVLHLVVHDPIDKHRHRVLGQDLKKQMSLTVKSTHCIDLLWITSWGGISYVWVLIST